MRWLDRLDEGIIGILEGIESRGPMVRKNKVAASLFHVFCTGESDRGPKACVAHPAEEARSVGTNRDCWAAWRLFHSGSLSAPRAAPAPCRTARTDCPQSFNDPKYG